MTYAATMTSAREHAANDQLERWVHEFLRGEGNNVPFSDGLKLAPRQYWGPTAFALRRLSRCTGPEPTMKYLVSPEDFESRVGRLQKALEDGVDLPPLIVNWSRGQLEVNDGNHRLEALTRAGRTEFDVILWASDPAEREEFQRKYRR